MQCRPAFLLLLWSVASSSTQQPNPSADEYKYAATINTSTVLRQITAMYLGLALGSWDKLAQGPDHHYRHQQNALAFNPSPKASKNGSTTVGGGTDTDADTGTDGSWPVITCEEYFQRDPRLLQYLKALAPGYLRFGDMPYFYGGGQQINLDPLRNRESARAPRSVCLRRRPATSCCFC